MWGAYCEFRGQWMPEASDLLELKLQAVVSHLYKYWELNLVPLQKQY